MVVCSVVRIRNHTSRTFLVTHAGDVFYQPRVAGSPVGSNVIEVTPGYDESAEDLVIPWAATSMAGLLVEEVDSGAQIRCVVGPKESDPTGMDWLLFHDTSWENILEAQWVCMGRRHILGTIGGTVDLQLSFRDCPGEPGSPAATSSGVVVLAQSLHLEREAACAPACTVFLNVYDLAPAASIPNAMLCNSIVKTLGAFHAAVEVYGEEWGFYRQANPEEPHSAVSSCTRIPPVDQPWDHASAGLGGVEPRSVGCHSQLAQQEV